MSVPEHKNPTQSNRVSRAPYNFVPLPGKVVTAANEPNDLPDHDCYHSGRHSGYFEVTLTTKSPLYIRCPMTRQEFDNDEQGKYADGTDKPDGNPDFKKLARNLENFFYTADKNKPVIPGSSLRGMIRSMLEIVSYSKVHWVSNKKLFFRTVDDTAVGRYYRSRMTDKVETGFLQRKQDGSYIIIKCEMARIKRDDIDNKFARNAFDGNAPNKTPKWNGESQPHQYNRIRVRLNESGKFVEEHTFNAANGNEWREGILVITGDVPRKSREFVFLLPNQNNSSSTVDVSEEIIKLFHHEDQITQWQQKAFNKNKPSESCRSSNGRLRTHPDDPGDPVFFLRENGELTFFGRAGMFILPYERNALELVPLPLREPSSVDFADAIFGYTDAKGEQTQQGEKSHSYAGRVFISDADWTGEGDPFEENIVPKILASPKPTAFQHYLTQQTPDQKDCLDHYGSKTQNGCDHETTIRGTKLYWHKGQVSIDDIKDPEQVDSKDTQHTQFKPVKSGESFKFKVHFENLSDEELGALSCALQPVGKEDKEYVHKLGMAKPLGMGAVKLEPHLFIFNRGVRYSTLFKENCWEEGIAAENDASKYVSAFENHVKEQLGVESPPLKDEQRIPMLLKMLKWPGPDPSMTEYVKLTGDEKVVWKERRVLPDPMKIE